MAPPTTSGAGSGGARARLAEAFDSSTGSVKRFDIANVPFRVVTPPRPRPLVSLMQGSSCKGVRKLFGNEFELRALQMASDVGIPKTKIEAILTSRVFRDDPHDNQPAVYIVVNEWNPEESPRSWQKVVERLKIYVNGRVSETPAANNIDISVEMVFRDLERQKFISPVGPDPRLEAAWPQIKAGIFSILGDFDSTAGHMTAIALFRLGFGDSGQNPKTVYVAVDYESPEVSWPPVVQKMQSFLDSSGFDLRVHLEHNTLGHQAFPLYPPDLTVEERLSSARDHNIPTRMAHSTPVNLGADIGAACYLERADKKITYPMVGTLGCWLEVKTIDKPWKVVALTNYHVIRPAVPGYIVGVTDAKSESGSVVRRSKQTAPVKNSELWTADVKGLFPIKVSSCHRVEHPTRTKHNFTVAMMQNRIRQLSAADAAGAAARVTYEAELQKGIAFFDGDKHYFGKVWFASGYQQRTLTNGRLDWALVAPSTEEEERVGRNVLPSEDDWAAYYGLDSWPQPSTFGGSLKPQFRSIHDLRNGYRVFKHGSSTMWTVGVFNRIKPDCSITDEKYMPGRTVEQRRSTEYMFTSEVGRTDEKPFGARGDSGAVVWDEHGRALGLLFTGQQPHQTKTGYCLVTPIEDVFDSIMKMSGGKIVDVRIAGTGT